MGLAPGTRVADRYLIEGPLGKGGMGAVYRARDERLDRAVALKALPPERIGDATAVARLIREARATAALEHDHIVPIYDVGSTGDGGAYLAMQLVNGTSLRSRVDRGPLPPAEALAIVVQIADALAFAHDAGIIHRDVKPDNVMLRADDGRAVVLDFGIAKREEAQTLTAEGAMVGTPAYLAPEQARGQDVDGRADQFALAVLAWELLTGRVPWSGTSLPEVLAKLLTEEPPPMGIAAAVEQVLRRALSKRRDDRFESMRAFGGALSRVSVDDARVEASDGSEVATAPTLEAPPTRSGVARWRRSTPYLGVAATVAAVVGLVVVGVAVREETAEPGGPEPAEEPPVGRVLDLPPPDCSDDAKEAYAEALGARYRGDWETAYAGFRATVELDERCASAALRVAHMGLTSSWAAELRRFAGIARANQGSLSERERALLHALEAVYFSEPPDRELYRARMARLAERFGDDAEMLAHSAMSSNAPLDARLDAAHRATELDPSFSVGWQALARVLDERGELTEAYAALARCTERSPGVECLVETIDLRALHADCEPIEELARQVRVRAPHSLVARLWLARVYASQNQPEERIQAELDAAFRIQPNPSMEHALRAMLAAHLGDHERALRIALETEAVARDVDAPGVTIAATALRIGALTELGREEEAADVARAYVLRSTSTLQAVTINGLRALREATILRAARPVLGEEPFRSELGRWRGSLSGNEALGPVDVWAMGDAGFADTPEEARASLDRAPGPIPVTRELGTLVQAGEALLLAGRSEEAVARLRPVAHGCYRLNHPYASTRAMLSLGRAQLASGDAAGACSTWAELEARWGATPSRTVTSARGLMRRHCSPERR